MTDLKKRALVLNSGKQIKLFGNSLAIAKSLQIGEGYAPNIFSCTEQQQLVTAGANSSAGSLENKPTSTATKTKTVISMANPYQLTEDELFEIADYNIRLWMDLKDRIRKYGADNPKVFNRDALV